MKQVQAGGKIVQQLERGGAVEINKASGNAARISSRDADISRNTGSDVINAADRAVSEASAIKKKTAKKAAAKIFKQNQSKPQTSRIKFTAEQRGDPALTRSIKRADKAADRYETTRGKVSKTKIKIERQPKDKPGISPDSKPGKTETKLVFTEKEKLPNGNLKHALARPVREVTLSTKKEMRKSDNVGVQGSEAAISTAGRTAGKLKEGYSKLNHQPQRALQKAEKATIKANSKALYKKSLRDNPKMQKANPIKKALHKRKIKKEYAKAFRSNSIKQAKTRIKAAKEAIKKIARVIRKLIGLLLKSKWGIIIIFVALLLILVIIGISSCATTFSGGINAILLTSYTAEDEDILGTDADYEAIEAALAAQIGRIETDYPGYDEYRYYLDEIGHDPFELASYLSAKYYAYTRDQVQADLAVLFSRQYELTLIPIIEIRTRIETVTETVTMTDPDTGIEYETEIEYEIEVEYEYYILEVELKNNGLTFAALPYLDEEQFQMYLVYMETQGNRPELFEDHPFARRADFLRYEVPPEALNDEQFAAMLHEAEKYLGFPYVWGGSSPSTSFDCSGFVSWVVNNSGWDIGRQGAKSLYNTCTPVSPFEAKPGDLIFFWKTYDAPDPNAPTHVGIYVGNGMMIHAGNPISYASVTTPYFTQKFYGFGRLP